MRPAGSAGHPGDGVLGDSPNQTWSPSGNRGPFEHDKPYRRRIAGGRTAGQHLESDPDAWAKAMASSENRLRDIRTSDPVASTRVDDVGPAEGCWTVALGRGRGPRPVRR